MLLLSVRNCERSAEIVPCLSPSSLLMIKIPMLCSFSDIKSLPIFPSKTYVPCAPQVLHIKHTTPLSKVLCSHVRHRPVCFSIATFLFSASSRTRLTSRSHNHLLCKSQTPFADVGTQHIPLKLCLYLPTMIVHCVHTLKCMRY